MKLYQDAGWLDLEAVESIDVPYIFVFGGRGIGKTYGMMDRINHAHRGECFFMRRTKTEWDIITDERMNMFASYNADNGTAFRFDVNKGIAEIMENDDFIGLSAPLSTFSNLRGFDNFQGINIIYYDEFIPERHKAKIRNEHEVFLNVYETINRNRELKGRNPVKCVCFANANDIKNPLFMGLNLVTMAEKMKRKEKEVLIDGRRGVALVDCSYSPISKKKAETALYKMAGDGDFYNMAIRNQFSNPLLPSVSRKLIEYKPYVSVGEIHIYRHKSNGLFYVSGHDSKNVLYYPATDTQLEIFRSVYGLSLTEAFYTRRVEFENPLVQVLFLTYLCIIK